MSKKNEAVVEETVSRRGRPEVYTGEKAKHIVQLVKKYGQTGAYKILHAKGKKKEDVILAGLRNSKIFPEAITISKPIMQKLCKAAGVELPKGRPSYADQAKLAKKMGLDSEAA